MIWSVYRTMSSSNYGAMKESQNPTGQEPLLNEKSNLPREGKEQQTNAEQYGGFCG